MKRREFLSVSAGLAGFVMQGPARSQGKPCPPPTLSVSGGGATQSTCASAELPSWVPTAGSVANVSLNNCVDVWHGNTFGNGSNLTEGWSDWCGAVWASDYGSHGAYIFGPGGGHGSASGYLGNEVYAWEADTRLWKRITNPVTSFADNQADGEVSTNIPAASHTYDHMEYLPASLGGGAFGSNVRVVSASNHMQGGGGSGRAHALNLKAARDDNLSGIGVGWSRWSSNLAPSSSGGRESACLLDTARNRFVVFQQGTGNIGLLSNTTKTWTTSAPAGPHINLDAAACYDPVADLYLILDNRSGHYLRAYDPKNQFSAGRITLKESGAAETTGAACLEYIPLLDKFACYRNGSSLNTIRYLSRPSGDPLTGTWTWTSETFSGVSVTSGHTNGLYSKLRWAPALKCLAAGMGPSQGLFLFRPSGT